MDDKIEAPEDSNKDLRDMLKTDINKQDKTEQLLRHVLSSALPPLPPPRSIAPSQFQMQDNMKNKQ